MVNPSVAEQFQVEIVDATYREVKRQRDVLQQQLNEARTLIRAFPSKLVEARLNAKLGLDQVKYDYAAASRVLHERV